MHVEKGRARENGLRKRFGVCATHLAEPKSGPNKRKTIDAIELQTD